MDDEHPFAAPREPPREAAVASAERGPRRGTAAIVVGLVLLTVTIALGVASMATLVGRVANPLGEMLTAPVRATPVDVALDLQPRGYLIYERTGTITRSGVVEQRTDTAPVLTPEAVTVEAPDGTRVPVVVHLGNATITRGDAVFSASLSFDAPAGGRYRVRVEPSDPTEIIVVANIVGSVSGLGAPVAGALLSLAGFLVGAVTLVVGLVMRARSGRPAPEPSRPAGALPAAGWYPDPGRFPAPGLAASMRYWDGARWTDHTT